MKPTHFPEANKVWAKDQPEYLPLPTYTDEDATTSCWQLTWVERLWVLVHGKIWLTQLNFGRALQPQLPAVVKPIMPPGERPS